MSRLFRNAVIGWGHFLSVWRGENKVSLWQEHFAPAILRQIGSGVLPHPLFPAWLPPSLPLPPLSSLHCSLLYTALCLRLAPFPSSGDSRPFLSHPASLDPRFLPHFAALPCSPLADLHALDARASIYSYQCVLSQCIVVMQRMDNLEEVSQHMTECRKCSLSPSRVLHLLRDGHCCESQAFVTNPGCSRKRRRIAQEGAGAPAGGTKHTPILGNTLLNSLYVFRSHQEEAEDDVDVISSQKASSEEEDDDLLMVLPLLPAACACARACACVCVRARVCVLAAEGRVEEGGVEEGGVEEVGVEEGGVEEVGGPWSYRVCVCMRACMCALGRQGRRQGDSSGRAGGRETDALGILTCFFFRCRQIQIHRQIQTG